ncbi:hypothetical protein BDZ85DRAFT_268191 [Elsinoe ampelina]|uniref:Uncharacterized protein n=1 Tax=Elsinoe ampelina TaxID=302913 RepID=A0A6A6G2D2_9PEZI|nr:hypothetical protein BDZ85DRAFT_268191 [Elsinoe ampelina]
MARAGKTMTWDAEADRKLLLAIIQTSDVKVEHEAVAKLMSTDEVTCSVIAIKRRMQKLKEMCDLESTTKPKKGEKRGAADAEDGDGEGGKKKRGKAGGEKGAAAKKQTSDQDDAVKEDQDIAGAIKEEDESDSE